MPTKKLESRCQKHDAVAREKRVRSPRRWTSSAESPANNPDELTLEMARIIAAVAKGDLTQSLDSKYSERAVHGDLGKLREAINMMLQELRQVTSEITRVTREAGAEGKLCARADLPGAGGVWRDLTNNVNGMVSVLTAHVRGMAELTTAEHLY